MDALLTMQSQSHGRTLADIQNKIDKRRKRNAISRAFHAKNDSQTITSWRMDLNRILLVFNVCFVVPARPALIVYSQTELGLNTYVAVSDVRDGVAKTHTVVADTHTVVAETHALVSDIRREVLGSREGVYDQHRSVSDIRTMPTIEYLFTISQGQTRSASLTTNESSILYLYLVYQVNRLPRRRGPVSDVTSW